MDKSKLRATFQSRFGPDEWLQPYTDKTVEALAKEGVKRIAVVNPGFVADCLETLEEIDQEARAAYLEAGGETFHYIPCLNDQHEWLSALSAIALRHLQGWPIAHEAADAAHAAQRARALAMGAKD